ncbi:MAG TPA: YfhO family protein [Acidimicrobiales bacterium]|nr:YfhO family protein [Acidimicrobiales bacterium]
MRRSPWSGGDVIAAPAGGRAEESAALDAREAEPPLSEPLPRVPRPRSLHQRLGPLGRAFAADEPLPGAPWWSRHGHLLLVLGAVLYGLIALEPERLQVAFPNDASVHLLTVATAAKDIAAGHLPFGSWFPDLATGSPFFLHYQSTPAVLTALLARLIGVASAFGIVQWLLFALLPLSVFWSGRLFGLGRYASAIASATALLFVSARSYGVEQQSYDWLGSGMWTQLWGIWVLPLAWGASYRAISRREFRALAVVLLGATIAFHFLTAYLAGLSLVVFVLIRPTRILRRAWWAAVVGGAAAALTLYVWLPLEHYSTWNAGNEFQVGTFWNDSFGARTVLGWLVSGRLYDNGRFPVVTILVGVGLVSAIARWRRDEAARAVVGVWLLSLALFFGRPTLGFVIDRLPGNSTLLLHRYVMGVHLAGMLLAGMGAVSIGQVALSLWQRLAARRETESGARPRRWWQPVLAAAVVIGALAPAWSQLLSRDQANAASIAAQRALDTTEGAQVNSLIATTRSLGGGRIFGGLLADSWEQTFRVGQIETCIYLADVGVDAVGFSLRTSALMNDPEADFQEANLADYDAFGIRFLILPAGMAPPVTARRVEQQGQYVLWSVASHGYVQVVDTEGELSANANDLGAQTVGFLRSTLAGQGIYPTVAFSGSPAAAPTFSSGNPVGSPGSVLSSVDSLDSGAFTATVTANRDAVVLLKASYDPGWQVTVDGVPTATEMIAPAFVGVEVAPGTHLVNFVYHGYPHYNLLFALDLLALLAVLFGAHLGRLASRLRRRVSEARARAS